MPRRETMFDEFDDALNRLYLAFQTTYLRAEAASGRVAVTARTRVPTGDLEVLQQHGDRGVALQRFLNLLPPRATLSVIPGASFDIFTLTW
jgi:ribosomal protein L35AE/L33A